jgi:hypothetical protein
MSTIQAVTYEDVNPITPGTNSVGEQYAGFIVTVAGTVQLTTLRGTAVTITVLAGVVYPIGFQAIAAGGTATGIFGLVAMPYKGAPLQT